MVEIIEIAWLGGLLEGEGYFGLSRKKYPRIGIEMTNEDTIIKVAAMWDSRVTRRRNTRRNTWITQVNGFKAVKWMMLLLPFLSKCRRSAIADVIKVWKEITYVNVDGIRRMAKCHPDSVAIAFGLCSYCYGRERRKKDKQLLRKVG